MINLFEGAKVYAGDHPQHEAVRPKAAGAGGATGIDRLAAMRVRAPHHIPQHGTLALGARTRLVAREKASDQVRTILRKKFQWTSNHAGAALEIKVPATVDSIAPYYLMKGCQFIQIGDGPAAGLYSLAGAIDIGGRKILAFKDIIQNPSFRVRMKAGDNFFGRHDWKLAIKIGINTSFLQKNPDRLNLNSAADRQVFLNWIIAAFKGGEGIGYDYASPYPWNVENIQLGEKGATLRLNRREQQRQALAVAIASLGGGADAGGGGGGDDDGDGVPRRSRRLAAVAPASAAATKGGRRKTKRKRRRTKRKRRRTKRKRRRTRRKRRRKKTRKKKY